MDDDPDIVAALEMLLAGEGFIVRTAFDGAAALAELARAPVDLVICDQSMPLLDGQALIERLRLRQDQTPVILMSAAERKVPMPRVSFLAKPFDIDRMLTLVERLIGSSGGR